MTHAPWTPEAQGATGTLAALGEDGGTHFPLACPPPERRGGGRERGGKESPIHPNRETDSSGESSR